MRVGALEPVAVEARADNTKSVVGVGPPPPLLSNENLALDCFDDFDRDGIVEIYKPFISK